MINKLDDTKPHTCEFPFERPEITRELRTLKSKINEIIKLVDEYGRIIGYCKEVSIYGEVGDEQKRANDIVNAKFDRVRRLIDGETGDSGEDISSPSSKNNQK